MTPEQIENEACYDRCLLCEKDMCFTCAHKRGKAVEYRHLYGASNTVSFCHECDEKLRKTRDYPLHVHLVLLDDLRKKTESDYNAGCEMQRTIAERIAKFLPTG